MGEYADMMLDGTCCQFCGEYLGSDNDFPTSCASCAGVDEHARPKEFLKEKQYKPIVDKAISSLLKFASIESKLEELLRRNICGILAKFYIAEEGFMQHDGMLKTLEHNANIQSKKRAKQLKRQQKQLDIRSVTVAQQSPKL